MGYNIKDENVTEQIINEESVHQTDLDDMQKHNDFAYPSFKIGMTSIRTLKKDIPDNTKTPIAVDVGSGGAPMGKILEDNGFNTYRCELDPNSLYQGLMWNNESPETGKHIVCDGSYLPFSNNSVDVVFCKEFIHHIYDYSSFFNEINRILKCGGILLMIEPTKTLISKDDDHFEHYFQTINKYFASLKNNNLKPYRYYFYYYTLSKKFKFFNILQRYYNKENISSKETNNINILLKKLMQRFIGGSNVIFSRKTGDVKIYKERPEIKIVEPNKLVLDENYFKDSRLNEIKEILNKVYEELNSN